MSLIPWSPLFDGSFQDVERWFESQVGAGRTQALAVDMYEQDGNVVVEAPLAGVRPEDVTVEISDGFLTIKGASHRKSEVDEQNYYRKEVHTGTFYRRVTLPQHLAQEGARATSEHGVLRITIPKIAPALPEKKVIHVEVK